MDTAIRTFYLLGAAVWLLGGGWFDNVAAAVTGVGLAILYLAYCTSD